MKPATQPVTHTPGPWTSANDGLGHLSLYGPDGYGIWHHTRTAQELDANRCLIESAPELLEALKEAKELIRLFHGDPAWEIYDSSSPEMKLLNAAISKATRAEGTQGEQR